MLFIVQPWSSLNLESIIFLNAWKCFFLSNFQQYISTFVITIISTIISQGEYCKCLETSSIIDQSLGWSLMKIAVKLRHQQSCYPLDIQLLAAEGQDPAKQRRFFAAPRPILGYEGDIEMVRRWPLDLSSQVPCLLLHWPSWHLRGQTCLGVLLEW